MSSKSPQWHYAGVERHLARAWLMGEVSIPLRLSFKRRDPKRQQGCCDRSDLSLMHLEVLYICQ